MLENEGISLANGSLSKSVAKPSARSRVSNGKDLFLDGVDGRSAIARRYRIAQLTSDIGGDPSEAQSIIIRQAWQAPQYRGVRHSHKTLRRLLLDLGLERRMRDITPSTTPTYRRHETKARLAGKRGRATPFTRLGAARGFSWGE
jgi:hypothetical protein